MSCVENNHAIQEGTVGAPRGRRVRAEGTGVGCMGSSRGYGRPANKHTGINLLRAASISK